MMKKFLKNSFIFVIFALMLYLLCFADKYSEASREGICIWALTVVPSLFPFVFLTMLLTKFSEGGIKSNGIERLMNNQFRCHGIAAKVFVLSLLSGYPLGAKMTADLHTKGVIDKNEATRMSTFCSTAGPMFIIGTVGICLFENKLYAFTMYLSHVISAVICGKIFCKYKDFTPKEALLANTEKSNNVLYESMYSAIISMLIVGGFICIFYVATAVLNDLSIIFYLSYPLEKLLSFHPDNTVISKGLVTGLIECTNGCKILSQSKTPLSAAFACSAISFGGLSVIFQSIVYLTQAKVKIRIFLLSKVIQSVISFIVCLALIKLADIF